MSNLKRYIPALNLFGFDGDDISVQDYSGSGTSTAVGAASSVTVNITHTALKLNVLPVVSTPTANASVDVSNVKPDSFDIVVTNNGGAAQDVDYTWNRSGI